MPAMTRLTVCVPTTGTAAVAVTVTIVAPASDAVAVLTDRVTVALELLQGLNVPVKVMAELPDATAKLPPLRFCTMPVLLLMLLLPLAFSIMRPALEKVPVLEMM